MFKKMFISIMGLNAVIVSTSVLTLANDNLAIKTDADNQEVLKVNNMYFLGDDIFEIGVYTNSLTIVLKEIAKYRSIIPSIPKPKTLILPSYYYNNSFSNGPVISEILAKKFSVDISPAWDLKWGWKVLTVTTTISSKNSGNNYAFAGATSYYDDNEYTSNQNIFLKNVFPRAKRDWSFIKEAIPLLTSKFSLTYQTDALINQHQSLKDNDLVLIQIGINDIKNLVEKAEKESNYDIEKYLDNSINNLKQAIEKLIANNAKRIVINNVFDLSKAPIYSKKDEKTLNDITNFVNIYNNNLKEMIATFESLHPNKVKLFDFYNEFNAIANQFSQKQINIKEQALQSIQHDQVLIDVFSIANEMQTDSSQIDKFLFLDDIHPTKIAHEIIADKIYDFFLNW